AAGDRVADELLVLAHPGAVDVRGVEERDAELEGPVDRGRRLVLVRLPVPGRHPHAAEALLGDLEPLSERSPVHRQNLPARRDPAASVYTGHRSWPSPSEKHRSRAATSAARRIRSAPPR